MIKLLNFSNAIVCLLLLTSCLSKKNDLSPSKEDLDILEINLNKNIYEDRQIDSLIEVKGIYPLETNKESTLSNIHKILHYRNNFYLLDKARNKLFIFNDSGKFIGLVGSRGHGPGEFIDVADFDIDKNGNQILVLSVEKTSVYFYDLMGEHIKTIKLPFQAFSLAINNKEQIAFYLSYFDKDYVNLKVTDINGSNIIFKGFEYPKDNRAMSLINITGGIRSNQDGFLYSDAISSYIHEITTDGQVRKKYHLDFESSYVEEENIYDFFSFFEDIQKGELSFLTNFYFENQNALAITYNRESSKQKDIIVQRYNALYDKNNNVVYSTEHLKKSFLGSYLSNTLGLTEDGNFISVINPIDYLNYQEENKNEFKLNNKELLAILNSMKEDDNPIIITYDLKK